MGNIIGNCVVKPNYEKVRGIVEMPAPTCKKDLQRLLGMLNYLSQYIPYVSIIIVPLRNLSKRMFLLSGILSKNKHLRKSKASYLHQKV